MKLNIIPDYFFILRPMLHLPVWTIAILGYYGTGPDHPGWGRLVLVLVLGTLLAGAVFVLNQIYDIESDRINNKLFFLAEGIISVRMAWLIVICLNIISLIIGFALSIKVGIVSVLIVLLGIFYSAPPAALKNRAWPAIFTNAIGHGSLIYLLGHVAAGGRWLPGVFKSLPYFIAVAAVYIGTTGPDLKGDKISGKQTIAVIYGEKATALIAFSFYLLALGAGFWQSDIPFLIAALAAGPFYVWGSFAGGTGRVFMAIKISVITLSLVAGFFFPPYLPFLIILIAVTRIYHKQKFGLAYPTIK